MTYLDLDTWPRRDHFHFFGGLDEPFFGITVRIDCTAAYHCCTTEGHAFFLYYLHRCLTAINRVEPFRYRIVEEYQRLMDEGSGGGRTTVAPSFGSAER